MARTVFCGYALIGSTILLIFIWMKTMQPNVYSRLKVYAQKTNGIPYLKTGEIPDLRTDDRPIKKTESTGKYSDIVKQERPVKVPVMYNWKNGQFELWNPSCQDEQFESTALKTINGNTPIYIYDSKDYISRQLLNYGVFESDNANSIQKMLSENSGMGFLDIGSHFGTFSLMAAKLGHRVISVDPMSSNALRFCKSVYSGKLTSLVTIFHVALSNKRGIIKLIRSINNSGRTFVEFVGSEVNNTKQEITPAVTLDDILPFIPFKTVFMKIDTESHEYQVFEGALETFKELDIRYILMEWVFHGQMVYKKSSADKIIPFLTSRQYVPHTPLGTPLQVDKFKEWPLDVLWKKKV
ncbi:hypothetical protein SNE40_003424 [Patella caerulea]|uniref:Methyltransferase FkbM domain-containing protein n=1 Tax=Patella caerulea TaxID=87958 RepID=A0AAN8KAP5_PATCE